MNVKYKIIKYQNLRIFLSRESIIRMRKWYIFQHLIIKFIFILIQEMMKMKRFSVLPCTLFRLQSQPNPILRDQRRQHSLGKTAFDFIPGKDDLYHPFVGDYFKVPNGLSMRPVGLFLAELLESFKASYIFELNQGLILPENMIVIHQRSDHFSLQTTVPIQVKKFESKVGQFLKKQKRITSDELASKIIKQLSNK